MSDISVNSLSNDAVDTSFRSEALANLDKDAFLQLLVAQMKYQNPLSPVDSNEYLAQAAQYASVEQLENMASSQQQLYSMQLVSVATDLVGKEVTAVDPFTGGELSGVVDVVRFGAEPILVIDGVEVGLSDVIDVRAQQPESATPAPQTTPEPETTPAPDTESADEPTETAEQPADDAPAAA